MVLCVGFLLLVSVLFSTTLAALEASWGLLFTLPSLAWQGADFVFSLIIVTLLFAWIFKVLPNVQLRWSDVWIGSGVTALLFTIGKFLIGFYLGTSGVASYYGAAGSAIIILLWVYYSVCILFFGAEFTKASVLKRSGEILPDHRAKLLSAQAKSPPKENPDVNVQHTPLESG
jgi:membrane protein